MTLKKSHPVEKLSSSWTDLEALDPKCIYFQDDIIPIAKRDNDNIYKTGYWLLINQKLYYFKAYNTKEKIIAELLGEEISKYFGLETVSFHLVKGYIIEKGVSIHVYGVLSKWARKENSKYRTFEDFFENYPSYNNLEFLKILNQKFKGEPITSEFKKLLVREYITNEFDRLANELLIEEKEKSFHLGYLCDYEEEFFSSNKIVSVPSFYNINLSSYRVCDTILGDEELKLEFLKSLDIPYPEIFKKLEEEKDLHIEEKLKERIISHYQEKQKEIRLKLSL